MRLDNRSRTILVSGDVTRSDSGKSGIREWYEGHGGNVEESTDGWKVGFPDRGMAEKVSCQIMECSVNWLEADEDRSWLWVRKIYLMQVG